MAWNDWSAFDTGGLIGGALGLKLVEAGGYFVKVADQLKSQAATSIARAEVMRGMWQQMDALNTAAKRDLDEFVARGLDAKVIGSVETIRGELAKAQSFLSSADLNLATARNVASLGRNLGVVVGAAELLYKLRNPDLKTYEFGESGVGLIGGIAAGAIGALFLPAMGALVFSAAGAAAAKAVWQHFVAPRLGWSEKDSPRFWDSVFEAIGVGQAPKGVGDRKPAEPDLPMRLALAGRHGLVAPPVTHLGSLSRRTSASGRAEYTLSDLDPDLANRMVDRRSFGIASWYQDEWLDSTVMALDSHPDGRIDRKDHVFESLAIWRDRDGNGDLAFDEFERFSQDDVILIDRSSAPTHATAGKPEHPPKQDAPDLMAIEARHRRSFTRYFDDLLGESADVPGEPRLRTLKASFEEAIKADAATGLSDLIDFARLVGPGALGRHDRMGFHAPDRSARLGPDVARRAPSPYRRASRFHHDAADADRQSRLKADSLTKRPRRPVASAAASRAYASGLLHATYRDRSSASLNPCGADADDFIESISLIFSCQALRRVRGRCLHRLAEKRSMPSRRR